MTSDSVPAILVEIEWLQLALVFCWDPYRGFTHRALSQTFRLTLQLCRQSFSAYLHCLYVRIAHKLGMGSIPHM